MTHPTLERHGEQWRHKKRIPADLLPHFGGVKTLTFSTKTADAREARAECLRWLADLSARFQGLRRVVEGGTAVPVRPGLTPQELGEVLAGEVARFKAEKLAADASAVGRRLLADGGAFSAEYRLSVIGIDRDSARLAVQGAFPGVLDEFEALALRRMAGVGVPLEKSSSEATDAALAFAEACLEVAEVVKQRAAGGFDSTPNPQPRPAPAVSVLVEADSAPLLSVVKAAFVQQHDPKAPVTKKYEAVLPLFIEFMGDVPVSQLRQKPVTEFFDMIQRLPPRWLDKRRQTGKTVQELAAMDWPERMAEKTFDDTYKMALRSFFKYARVTFGDNGWPIHLTTEGIKYRGTEEEGKNRQRPMRPEELQRLFEGPEAAAFAADPSQASAYWLPLLGLYTGARINELCQLNPQCDIRDDDPQAPGVWFLDITEEGAAAEGVDKSVKNKTSKRRVPVHSTLVGLGFVDYVKRLKAAGEALLFPMWAPVKGRAAGGAERWFRLHLQALGLRDESRGARLVGFHAFRSTFMARAEEINEPRADAISGHSREGESAVKRGYRGETPLRVKVEILERITFDVTPPRPRS